MPAIGGGERYFQSDPYSEPEISSYSIRLSYPAMDDLLGLIIIDGSHNYNPWRVVVQSKHRKVCHEGCSTA